MAADPKGVLTGVHFLDGDQACCEGALAAGARFAAGYPITPSTEIVERFAARIPTVGGTFIQMEDELAASITILGAVWGGAKAFPVTSGPGFSLMMEPVDSVVRWLSSKFLSEDEKRQVGIITEQVRAEARAGEAVLDAAADEAVDDAPAAKVIELPTMQ